MGEHFYYLLTFNSYRCFLAFHLLFIRMGQIWNCRGHGGVVVIHSPSTPKVCHSIRPYVGKLVVAYQWLVAYGTEPCTTVCAGYLCPQKHLSWYDLRYTVLKVTLKKPQIIGNYKIVLTADHPPSLCLQGLLQVCMELLHAGGEKSFLWFHIICLFIFTFHLCCLFHKFFTLIFFFNKVY